MINKSYEEEIFSTGKFLVMHTFKLKYNKKINNNDYNSK